MTAPVAPSAPAPSAPSTPIAAPPAVQRTFNDTISHLSQNTGIAPDAASPVAPIVQIVKDAPPPLVPPGAASPDSDAGDSAALSSASPPDGDNGPPPAPDAAAVVEATGEIIMEEDGIALRAERNADGTFKSKLDPSMKLDFEVKGENGETKKYTKSLPDILRMARDGIWGQQVRQEVTYYRENVPRWESHTTDLTAKLDAQMTLNRELLSADPETVNARRAEYQAEMSPEKQLERLRAEKLRETDAQRSREQQELVTHRAQSFIQTRLAPTIKNAEDSLGVEVVAGKLALATAPLLVNGVIPPDRWPVMEQYINGPFKVWVQAEAAKLKSTRDARALSEERTAAAQRKAQAAVNDAGRAMVPVGSPAPDTPPALPKATTIQEVKNRLIHRPLPQTVGASG